jgi:uroporphyrinogen-III synthase
MFASVVHIRPAARIDVRHPWAALVLHEAARVEPDEAARMAWYHGDPIAALGQQTAESLVACGRHEEVLGFIRRVAHDLGLEPARAFAAF